MKIDEVKEDYNKEKSPTKPKEKVDENEKDNITSELIKSDDSAKIPEITVQKEEDTVDKENEKVKILDDNATPEPEETKEIESLTIAKEEEPDEEKKPVRTKKKTIKIDGEEEEKDLEELPKDNLDNKPEEKNLLEKILEDEPKEESAQYIQMDMDKDKKENENEKPKDTTDKKSKKKRKKSKKMKPDDDDKIKKEEYKKGDEEVPSSEMEKIGIVEEKPKEEEEPKEYITGIREDIDLDSIYYMILNILKERNKNRSIKKIRKDKIYNLLENIKDNKDTDEDDEKLEIKEGDEQIISQEKGADNEPENGEYSDKPGLIETYKRILVILGQKFKNIKNRNKNRLLVILKEIEDDNKNIKGEDLIKEILIKRNIRKYYKIWKEKENADKPKDDLELLKKIINKNNKKAYFYGWKNHPDLKNQEIDDNVDEKNKKLFKIVKKSINRNNLLYYFQKWKIVKPKKVIIKGKKIIKDNNNVDNIIDNLLLKQDDEDEKEFEDLSDLLSKDNKKGKNIVKDDTGDIEKGPNVEAPYEGENAENAKLIKLDKNRMENVVKPKLIKIIKNRNIKRYFYSWKQRPDIKEDEVHDKEYEIIAPSEKQLRGRKKKSVPRENESVVNKEEPINGVIIREDKGKDRAEPDKENRTKLLKKIILKRNMKRVFYKWYEMSVKVTSRGSCLDGIYGYCYTEHFTSQSYEYATIHGNIDSNEVSCTIRPLFSVFLKNMNLSVAAFNLFSFYSQLRDESILIKKKYLPIWRKVIKIKKIKE